MAEENNAGRNLNEEYSVLLIRSQELFNDVRNMPRYGMSHWQEHFLKTFEVFTKLWKFQQENRFTLEKNMNLQRSQVGDIASRIGQLYYHYYLHTSDAKYLYESLNFYSAIYKRSYYVIEDSALCTKEMCVKYLRYLTRYFVVASLIRDDKLMTEIIKGLETHVDKLSIEDKSVKNDWLLVLKEANTFSEVDNFLTVNDETSQTICLHYRLPFPKGETGKSNYKLKSALIIGSCEKQAKFSELTIDMYRMVHLLEYEPSLNTSENNITSGSCNPQKHLLYKPSFAQTYAFLTAIFKDLVMTTHTLLIYISGNTEPFEYNENGGGFYFDGVEMMSTKERVNCTKKINKSFTNPFCLYPEDLVPFTRRPLFLIIDSQNSSAYSTMPNVFNQPMICLMAPECLPEHLKSKRLGGLFTLFLLEPLLGICKLCGVTTLPNYLWTKMKNTVDKVGLQAVEQLLEKSKQETSVYENLLQDNFLRTIMARYIVTWMVLRLYKNSKGPASLPKCTPEINREVLENKFLYRQLMDIFAQLNRRDLFYDLTEVLSLFTTS